MGLQIADINVAGCILANGVLLCEKMASLVNSEQLQRELRRTAVEIRSSQWHCIYWSIELS